ncbi:basic helix-loop-helix domain-containing protein [Aspergillus candidus]|uniref:BHLH domain-containing protein n=1 Tax=Aspergillus candidus TaxID=41067 RepID=A0A2I2F495_ASPCN|nr:hypothetical protein BDW47DRAFT_110378 [Aspergillus candidus]PLB35463.1 hypothetical protein BDW47DRAFT_110378 [Aspergillus candidus]
MSRSRLPPTPAMSGELIIKEQTSLDGTDLFALPPAAVSPSNQDHPSRRSSRSDPSVYYPVSPTSPDASQSRANQPRQTGVKRPLEDFGLPPPPTRTRKIIQMKPKAHTQPKPPPPANKSRENAKAPINSPTAAASKKKQPSATSAAGRKIARKTAHSLIERRRRSKMNEEFSTLKDMIPACQGQEMHKLAILQASIDYVNYLEQCVQDLKTTDQPATAPLRMPPGPPSPTSPEILGDEAEDPSASVSPDLPPYQVPKGQTSLAGSPWSGVPSTVAAVEPLPSILPSPALGPMYLADHGIPSSHASWTASSANTSPALCPQYMNPSANLDHEASAALLMLNRECRRSVGSVGSVGSVEGHPTPPEGPRAAMPDPHKKTGMSVRELLIS